MKILIVGHACSPCAGSEPSFTWNWACQLSRFHRVWVVAHPHHRFLVDRFLANDQNGNLRFHWIDVPRFLDSWDGQVGRHDRGLRFHYLAWLPLAYRKAMELHRQVGFDLVHHVSYGSVSVPPPVRKLGVPFVWGPIGGAQRAPAAFRRYFGSAWSREVVRNARVRLLRFHPSARSAAKASLVTLATNQETADLLQQIGARGVRLYLDSGIPSGFVSDGDFPLRGGTSLTLLWAGRMQPRKALPLALEGLALADDLPVRLLIAGDGEMRKTWEVYAKRLGLAHRVEFLGKVPWDEMAGVYRRADALLFTSLRDSFGTQVLEAMGQGLPILTLDHQGVGTFLPPDAGIKIPVTTPRETALGIADGIRRLARNPDERGRMGEAGRAFARTQTWAKRGEWMSKLYEEVLSPEVSVRLGAPTAYAPYSAEKQARTFPETTAQSVPACLVSQNISFEVLGVRVRAVQMPDVVARMQEWIGKGDRCRSIAPTDMHCVVEAQHNPSFKELLNSTDLVVPDGMPLVWLGRRSGHHLPRRVYGPDLMLEFCQKTAGRGYRHFLYGGEPGVPARLAESLKAQFPGLNVVGTYSPPFRPLAPAEDQEIVEMISRAAPDVLWVGLGAPKQERWMHEHRDRLHVPVLVSVGAAFDILSGRRKQAPRWMREHGLEWLFRLFQEPRRLWRRYLIYGAEFIAYLAADWLRLKDFDAGRREPETSVRSVPAARAVKARGTE